MNYPQSVFLVCNGSNLITAFTTHELATEFIETRGDKEVLRIEEMTVTRDIADTNIPDVFYINYLAPHSPLRKRLAELFSIQDENYNPALEEAIRIQLAPKSPTNLEQSDHHINKAICIYLDDKESFYVLAPTRLEAEELYLSTLEDIFV